MKRLACLALCLLACDGGEEPLGAVRFALAGDAAYFRLRIYAKTPQLLSDKTVFDTGCLQQESHTYELSNIPVGQGYTVVYQGFSEFGCEPEKAVSLGYRGEVAISKSQQPYYHVQIYPTGDVAALPEDINLSASVATAVDFCDDPSDCAAGQVCYDVTKPEYWCVPSCSQDSDCAGIHLRGVCERSTGWCMLRSPFPLNLSEPRAFGAAATLADGDVLFVGGLRQNGGGTFLPTMYPLERFDAQTGLFAGAHGEGAPAIGGYVGGLLQWHDAGGLELTTEAADVSADVVVWDVPQAAAKSVVLARGVALPTVVRLAADRFFIAGGLVVSGPGLEATRSTWLCTVSEGAPSCEQGPSLDSPRQQAAASCLDADCNRVLLFGGSPGGKLAEVVDLAAGSATALKTTGLGDKVFAPVLCGLDLVGGSSELLRATPFTPMRLVPGDGTLDASALSNAPASAYLAAVSGVDPSFGASPSCFIGGGLEGGAATQSTLQRITSSSGGSMTQLGAALGRARFGAMAGRVGAGLLTGRVLFAGGVALAGDGPVTVVRGAEILSP